MTRVLDSDAVKKLTEEWYRKVWNERSPGAIEELMADDAIIEGLEILPEGKEAFRDFRNAIVKVFDDFRVQIKTLTVEGSMSMGESVVTAIHKETGKPLHMKVDYEARWKDGQLVHGKNVVDYLELIEQTGFTGLDMLGKPTRVVNPDEEE